MKKIWVVELQAVSRKSTIRDKKIVRAHDRKGAIRQAKSLSIVFGSKKSLAHAYIADPVLDLGMRTKKETLKMYDDIKSAVNIKQ